MKLRIYTQNCSTYLVNERGMIYRPGTKPSGQWLFLGIDHVKENRYISREKFISMLEIGTPPLEWWTYKNGKGKWTVRDLDHGATRRWASDRIRAITEVK